MTGSGGGGADPTRGQPRRVLLLTEVFPPQTGGSGRWFWEVYRRMPRNEVVVAARDYPGHEAFDRTHELDVRRLPLAFESWGILRGSYRANYHKLYKQLLNLVRTEKIGQIHCARCLPEGLLALALRWRVGLPYLVYVHGEEINTSSESRELTFLARRALKGARIVIANSANTKRMLLTEWGLADEHVRVVHPGVDADLFVPAARDADWRRRVGWGDRKVIVTVGRLQRRKGHDTMIQALPRIRRAIPDVLYAIVGAGEEKESLVALAREHGVLDYVWFAGEIGDGDLVRYYQQCDLFALPNRQIGKDIEGFGIVLLEAQSCGRPVLAGASGGTAETMRVPETGRTVPCDTPGPLADCVIELLSDPARLESMGQVARRWITEEFDWKVLGPRTIDVFYQTMSRGAKGG